jgi:hypothetical protein
MNWDYVEYIFMYFIDVSCRAKNLMIFTPPSECVHFISKIRFRLEAVWNNFWDLDKKKFMWGIVRELSKDPKNSSHPHFNTSFTRQK